jgi:hypothetical protein
MSPSQADRRRLVEGDPGFVELAQMKPADRSFFSEPSVRKRLIRSFRIRYQRGITCPTRAQQKERRHEYDYAITTGQPQECCRERP